MSPIWLADSLLQLPPAGNGDHYLRNYLRQAVCELRFPTLLSLAENRMPASFAMALRKVYPVQETMIEVGVNMGARTDSSYHHAFRSNNGLWVVTLKSSSVSIETTRYTRFEEMLARVKMVTDALVPVIDSEFFTRIGLRYINLVETSTPLLQDWVCQALVYPLALGMFKRVGESSGRLQMQAEDGGCLLQHGLRLKPGASSLPGEPVPTPDYVIDIDVFRQDVAVADAQAAIERAHGQAFALFDWTLGPKARDFLSQART